MCRQLAQTSYTRRAQAITWKVWEDAHCYDPACLQSIWCRIIEQEGVPRLSMNVRFRSNDAYKAAFMNIFALVQLQQRIARRVTELTGRHVALGRYCHLADSYHIYGSSMAEFQARFLGALQSRDFAGRTMRYADVKDLMDEARPAILEKVRQHGRPD
jgi:thymidylate synthase